jgi:hypothetical protein
LHQVWLKAGAPAQQGPYTHHKLDGICPARTVDLVFPLWTCTIYRGLPCPHHKLDGRSLALWFPPLDLHQCTPLTTSSKQALCYLYMLQAGWDVLVVTRPVLALWSRLWSCTLLSPPPPQKTRTSGWDVLVVTWPMLALWFLPSWTVPLPLTHIQPPSNKLVLSVHVPGWLGCAGRDMAYAGALVPTLVPRIGCKATDHTRSRAATAWSAAHCVLELLWCSQGELVYWYRGRVRGRVGCASAVSWSVCGGRGLGWPVWPRSLDASLLTTLRVELQQRGQRPTVFWSSYVAASITVDGQESPYSTPGRSYGAAAQHSHSL